MFVNIFYQLYMHIEKKFKITKSVIKFYLEIY